VAGQQDPSAELTSPGTRLGREFFEPDPVLVAPALLGCLLVCDRPAGRVVLRLTEVEAYRGEGIDPGSHAFRGRTPRTGVMFGPGGHLYVYFSYGMHWCANVVCGPDGQAGAVLLRAGEVVQGGDLARSRRPAAKRDPDLARGPARLTQAVGIQAQHNGADLCADGAAVWLATGPAPTRGVRSGIRTGPRVGVAGAGGDGAAFPWRFWLNGEPSVSVFRPGKVRRSRPQPGATLTGPSAH
jgi:DNA-3-methyladenine glycosylase